MLVVSSSVEQTHGFRFHGLGRPALADPNKFESYQPGRWWAKSFPNPEFLRERLLVPMDSRTTASERGSEEYAFYRIGGWSWCTPYLAGAFALAAQVAPAITPDRFWSLALKTGRTIRVRQGGEEYSLGLILDPVALVRALPPK